MEQEQKQQAETVAQPKPADSQRKGLRIFISGCNSLLGYTLIEELRNDHIEDEEEGKAHLFVGTLDRFDTTNPPPSNVKRVVSGHKRSFFTKLLMDCDIVIYDVRTANPDEIRFVAESNVQYLWHRIQRNEP